MVSGGASLQLSLHLPTGKEHQTLLLFNVACRNNEVKFIGQFGEQGVRYSLQVPKGQAEVLSRQVPFYSPKSAPDSTRQRPLLLVVNSAGMAGGEIRQCVCDGA